MKYFMRKLGKISAVGLTCFILAGNELGGYACADSWRMPQGAILRCSEDSLGLTLLAGNTVCPRRRDQRAVDWKWDEG